MVKLNKIYTATGDDGTTGLVDGSRVTKHSSRVAAYGDVDEANAVIGLLRLTIKNTLPACGDAESVSSNSNDTAESPPPAPPQAGGSIDEVLGIIQNELCDMGADLATPMEYQGEVEPLRITKSQVDRLEKEIDQMISEQEPLTSFVLPGGTEAAVIAHMARTVTRRAERNACALAESEGINKHALRYLNRLSDYLFVLARKLNNNGKDDVLWVPGESR